MSETIAGVRIPDSRIACDSHRVDSRHDHAVDLSPLTPGVSVRQLAITMARYRARPRIAIRGSAIP